MITTEPHDPQLVQDAERLLQADFDHRTDQRTLLEYSTEARKTIRRLLTALGEAEQREAEAHDVLALLWSLTDPEDAAIIESGVLPRVNQLLGANDPDGQCGNRICALVADLEAKLAAAEQRVTELTTWKTDALASMTDAEATEERETLRKELASGKEAFADLHAIWLREEQESIEALQRAEAAEASLTACRALIEQMQPYLQHKSTCAATRCSQCGHDKVHHRSACQAFLLEEGRPQCSCAAFVAMTCDCGLTKCADDLATALKEK